jgi:hypothetical protein
MPEERILQSPRKWFITIPMNMAITAPPMMWTGSRFSIMVATSAIRTDKIIPGKSLRTDIIFPPFFIPLDYNAKM